MTNNLIAVPLTDFEKERGMLLHFRKEGLPPEKPEPRCAVCGLLLGYRGVSTFGLKGIGKFCTQHKARRNKRVERAIASLIALIVVMLSVIITPGAYAQGGNLGSNSTPVVNRQGIPLPGVNIAVCQPMATTSAIVTNNLAVLTMSSNPITAGYKSGLAILVDGFTGGDTYLNAGTLTNGQINGGWTILSVSATAITFQISHVDAVSSSDGSVLQEGNGTNSCAALAPVFSDTALATPVTQPFVSDQLGNWNVFGTPGIYFVQFYAPQIATSLRQIVDSCVPGTTVSSCAGSTSPLTAGLVGFGSASNVLSGQANFNFNAITGNLNVPSINNTIYIDGNKYPCNSTGLNSAIAAAELYGPGSTVDARGCVTGTISSTVTVGTGVGSSDIPVVFLANSSTNWNCTITNSTGCFDINSSSAFKFVGETQTPGGVGGITLSNSAHVLYVVGLINQGASANGAGFLLDGFTIQPNTTATIDRAAIYLLNPLQIGTIRNVTAAAMRTNLMEITETAPGGGAGPINIDNVQLDCQGLSGCVPFLEQGAVSGGVMAGINFFGGVLAHPGADTHVIADLESLNAGNDCAGTNFYGTQLESSNAADIGILINGCTGIRIDGVIASAVTPGTAVVKITGASTDGVVIVGLNNFDLWTYNVQNTINSVNYLATNNRMNYSYFSPFRTNTTIIDDGTGNQLTVDSNGITTPRLNTNNFTLGPNAAGTATLSVIQNVNNIYGSGANSSFFIIGNNNGGSSAGDAIIFKGDGNTSRAAIQVLSGTAATDVGCIGLIAGGQGSSTDLSGDQLKLCTALMTVSVPVKITGLADGCIQAMSGVLTSTTVPCGTGAGGSSITVNGGSPLPTPVNLENGPAVNGVIITQTNPSLGNVQAAMSGTLNDAGITIAYSGVGACGTHLFASTLTRAAAPTCTQPTLADLAAGAAAAGLYNFSAATMEIPQSAGFTSSSVSTIGIDTTNPNLHVYLGSDLTVPSVHSTIVNGHCLTGFVSGGLIAIQDSGVVGCSGSGGGVTLETNNGNNSDQTFLNLLNSAAFNGLTFTFTNTSLGNVQAGFTGTLGNAGLTNPSLTINTTTPLGGGGSMALGSTNTLTCTTCDVSASTILDTSVVLGAGGARGLAGSFLTFTGPASTLKSFALPNASATILTSNSPVTVPQGGTGEVTLTAHGVLMGEGTSALGVSAAGTSGQPFLSGGASADGAYGALNLASAAVTGLLAGTNGGDGVNNGATTLTRAANVTFAGAFASTFTLTGITAVTFPTTGVLATNPLTILGDVAYGGASGVLTRLAGPTGPNTTYFLVDNVSAGVATAEVFAPAGQPCPTITTTYTLLDSDRGHCLIFNSATPFTVTIPAANSTGFANNYITQLLEVGAGTVTFNITTSTATIITGTNPVLTGQSSFQLTTGQFATIRSPDNSSYLVNETVSGSSGGVASCSTQFALFWAASTGTTATCNPSIKSDASNDLFVGGPDISVNGGLAAYGGTFGTSGVVLYGVEGTAPTCKASWEFQWADSTSHRFNECDNNGTVFNVAETLAGTSSSIGGGALLAGACAGTTVTITGAAVGMATQATPATYPGDGSYWLSYVSSSNTVTVKVCGVVAITPSASVYAVRLVK